MKKKIELESITRGPLLINVLSNGSVCNSTTTVCEKITFGGQYSQYVDNTVLKHVSHEAKQQHMCLYTL